ncbi:hypothetical protein C8Q79DRAFT_262236 [Trametes meyenii]|nr:hypothetical protein C8Q79DRAFT_262236 [Trametes meyenii]
MKVFLTLVTCLLKHSVLPYPITMGRLRLGHQHTTVLYSDFNVAHCRYLVVLSPQCTLHSLVPPGHSAARYDVGLGRLMGMLPGLQALQIWMTPTVPALSSIASRWLRASSRENIRSPGLSIPSYAGAPGRRGPSRALSC